MRRVAIAGAALTVVSLAGYVAGVSGHAFPGRSFTVTGILVGIALLVVGGAE